MIVGWISAQFLHGEESTIIIVSTFTQVRISHMEPFVKLTRKVKKIEFLAFLYTFLLLIK